MENLDRNGISEQLKATFGSAFEIYQWSPLSGGDINEVYRLNTSSGELCIKLNDQFPGMFEREASGLALLKKQTRFAIPEVISTGKQGQYGFLLMSYIESAKPKADFWTLFGERLAEMYQVSDQYFGLTQDNFIGSLPQSNQQRTNWSDFYYFERMLPQIEMAIDSGKMDTSFKTKAKALYAKLNNIFPHEPPALLHGDLWSGNYMVSDSGTPALIDPAVYFGHREMDLAMMQLFGGFDRKVFDVYHSNHRLEKNWEERIRLCQLYPVLVHVNLFGGSYINQAEGILNIYV